ncbi:Phosphoesterase family domain containing protein [Naviculisporaceae sp. PSN 640]
MKILPKRKRATVTSIWAAALTSTLLATTMGSIFPGVIATETANNKHQQQQRRDVILQNPPPEPPFVRIHDPPKPYQPSLAQIAAMRKDAIRKNPPGKKSRTSHVKGHAFDRIVQIWLENQDFENCEKDPNMQFLASKGILLTNYYGVTHPSQPNYVASVAGDTFGLDNDKFFAFPSNISTVVDLLDTRQITWAEYQEHLPFVGFEGARYSQGKKIPPDYVRKHNPLIMFDSVAKNETRTRNIKGLDAFYRDLEDRRLPQWIFITPNMTNNAHDTNITYSAKWLRGFLEPLLNNAYFMDRTLVVVTFDETEIFETPNRVFTLLLGGAIPRSLQHTKDPMFYSHYSLLSTVSLNWDLPSLGRWDCDANILPPLSHILSYKNTHIPQSKYAHWNKFYPGPASRKRHTPGWWPVPNTVARCVSGRGVLEQVKNTWGINQRGSYNYTSVFSYRRGFDGLGRQVRRESGIVRPGKSRFRWGRGWGTGSLGGVMDLVHGSKNQRRQEPERELSLLSGFRWGWRTANLGGVMDVLHGHGKNREREPERAAVESPIASASVEVPGPETAADADEDQDSEDLELDLDPAWDFAWDLEEPEIEFEEDDTDTETEAPLDIYGYGYGEGPFQPVDGVMDRGFSFSFSFNTNTAVGEHELGGRSYLEWLVSLHWNGTIEEKVKIYEAWNLTASLSLKGRSVHPDPDQNGAAARYSGLRKRLEIVLVLEVLIAGVAWML